MAKTKASLPDAVTTMSSGGDDAGGTTTPPYKALAIRDINK